MTYRFHWQVNFVLLLVVGGLVSAFTGLGKAPVVIPRTESERNVLRVACTQSMVPDPQMRSFPLPQYNQLMLSLWEPLVECDPVTGEPQPAAAKSWEWSNDRLSLTILLRPDSFWSNGDPVTAHDFVRSWLRLISRNKEGAEILAPLKNARAFQKGEIKEANQVGVHALDDRTLRVDLEKPRSTLMMELADPLLSPLHATHQEVLENKGYFTNPSSLVTNGPFQLAQANLDGYKLVRNKFHRDRAALRLDGVNFIRADSSAMAELLLSAGAIDLLTPTAKGKTPSLPTGRAFKVASELEPTVNAIDLNVTHAPLNDVRVRRALSLALDRAGSVEQHEPNRKRAAWSWVPQMPGRPGLSILKEDAEEARRLLAAAGFPGGRGFPVLRMALPLWSRPNYFALDASERWFKELGIRSYVAYEFTKKHSERMRVGDYDLLYNSLVATVPDAGDLLGTFQWPSNFNATRWHDDEMVALLTEADSQVGSERLVTLAKAEQRVMAEIPSIPLLFEVRWTIFSAEVHGWYSDPLGRQGFKHLYLEPAS